MAIHSIQVNSPTNLRVTAFIDGNGGLQSVAKNRVADLEKLQRQHGDEFQAGATVFMQGPTSADMAATAKAGLSDVGRSALYAGGLLVAAFATGLAVAVALLQVSIRVES